MNTAARVLRISSYGFFGFGLWAVIDPASMLAFVEVIDLPAAARAETRAFYGGLEFGFGWFLRWSARRPARIESALVAASAVFAGCAVTRALAMAWDGVINFGLAGSYAGEIAGAAFTLWGLRRWRRISADPPGSSESGH